MMIVVLVFREDVLRLICGYVPQNGRRIYIKKTTCDGQFHMHCADYLVMCIGEFN